MPLLNIKVKKNVTITCKVEESTAKMVDLYAEFLNVPGEAVVNEALSHVFKLDKQFKKYLEERGDVKAEPSLKVKKEVVAEKKLKGQRKRVIAIAQ